ncbi:4808_t:CDS:1, partial [Funneliformis geosporum]
MLLQILCLHSNIDDITIFEEEGFKGVLFHVKVNVSDMQDALLELHIFFVCSIF